MTRCVARRVLAWTSIACATLANSGCKSADKPITSPSPASPSVTHDASSVDGKSPSESTPPIGALEAGEVQVGELRISQEVLLHAALYRAAFAARVGEARHVILEPVSEQHPPNLGVDPSEFRSGVLVELRDLGMTVAWAPSTWRTQAADVFPGTDEPATRLTAAIISRDEDQATVTAEIGDRTAGSLSSRQRVTATWDGARWRVERGRARVIW